MGASISMGGSEGAPTFFLCGVVSSKLSMMQKGV